MARAFVLLVEHDRQGCRLLTDLLRGRYGHRVHVVGVEDGRTGTDVLRQLPRSGQETRLVLAAYQGPDGGAGLDLLTAATDIAPGAARVLTTTSQDTARPAAAAAARLGLDGWVSDPPAPPHGGLLALLDQHLAHERPPAGQATALTVIGHRWCARTQAARDFLARNEVPFRMVDVTSPTGRALLLGLGRPTDPGVLPVGASEGLRTLLLEREATGGQAGTSSRIENYLGFPDGLTGADLARRAKAQAVRFGVEIVTAAEVTGIRPRGDSQALTLAGGAQVTALASILATGVSYRRLGAGRVDDYVGRGLFYGAAAHNAADCEGEDVYVVGAANSAGQAALYFAERARRVTVLCRAPDLGRGMSRYLVSRIEEAPNIDVRPCTEVLDAVGAEHNEQVLLGDASRGTRTWVPCGRLFLFIGALPHTGWLPAGVVRDDRGFILTGTDLLARHGGRAPAGWPSTRPPQALECGVPSLFAVGDVRATSVKRVAAAVGEGALAVSLVHQHLSGQP